MTTVTEQLESFQGQVKLIDADKKTVEAVQTLLIHFGLLDDKADGVPGKKTLAAFAEFKEKEYLEAPDTLGETTVKVLLESYKEHPTPAEDNDQGIPAGEKVIVLPTGKEVYSSMPIYPGSHFTWGEFTKNLSRVPDQKVITNNIIKLARHLDEVRDFLGDKVISINSGYRPPAINRAVGGVSNSRHILGDAVDIVVEGLTPYEVYAKLDSWHGNKGGLGKSSVFTHLDMRGYKARFRYGR